MSTAQRTANNFAQFCRAVRAPDAEQLRTKVCSLKIVTTNEQFKSSCTEQHHCSIAGVG